MKQYYVKTNNVDCLKSALSRMIEYAMFMAEECGSKDRIEFVNTILDEENIVVQVEETR